MGLEYWPGCQDRLEPRHPRLRMTTIVAELVAITVVFLMPGFPAGAAPSEKNRIVFVSTRGGDSWQVYIMNLDGSHPKRLTNVVGHHRYPPGAYTTPQLSPDGRHILFGAFTSGGLKPGDRGIYLMNADGSDLHRLTNLQAEDAAFSFDGRRIAFVAFQPGQQLIYTMNVDGSNVVNTAQVGYAPAWSPDGQRIAFTCGYEICAMNDDGSHLVRLTDNRRYSVAPQFSRDGRTIVFQSLHGSIGPWFEISLMDADGSNDHRLSPPSWIGESPSFTLDGRVVFVSQTPHANPNGMMPSYSNRQIYVVNVDGTNLHCLTDPPGENGFAPFGYLY
jgi:Tol biopolymer transport system component